MQWAEVMHVLAHTLKNTVSRVNATYSKDGIQFLQDTVHFLSQYPLKLGLLQRTECNTHVQRGGREMR